MPVWKWKEIQEMLRKKLIFNESIGLYRKVETKMKLLIVRHGDPDYSIDSLTEKGWREAELLSKKTFKT